MPTCVFIGLGLMASCRKRDPRTRNLSHQADTEVVLSAVQQSAQERTFKLISMSIMERNLLFFSLFCLC